MHRRTSHAASADPSRIWKGDPTHGRGRADSDAVALEPRAHDFERDRHHVLDLHKLETFRVVAETLNFTRAAVKLGYSQSSVTTHIKAIERELGTRMFDRCRFSRDVVLTEAGQITLLYTKRLLALADETKTAVRDVRARPTSR